MQKQMKKILTGATVGATVVATGLNVQAEEVVTTDVAQPTATETTTATSTTTIPSSAEIKPALNEAKSNVDELDTVVADGEKTVAEQEKTLASAEAKVVEAESSVATAKSELATAEERVVESTPENIETAKQNVATATESVSNKTEAVSSLETAKADAEANVTAKSTEVATAQSDVATQEKTVATAQTGVEKASQDVTTASKNLTSAKESVTTLEGIVAEDTQAVADSKNAYDKAVYDQENKTQAIASAESTVATNKTTLDNATSNLASATSTKENAQSTVDSAQSAYDTALKGTTTTKEVTTYKEELVGAKVTATGANYTPKFTDATIQAIKDYQSGKITKDALRKVMEGDALTVPVAFVGLDDPFDMGLTTTLGMQHLTQYLEVNDADKTVYNVDTLPSDVLDDVALFAVAHINSMRAQVGKAPFELSGTSMGIARQVLDTFLTEDWKRGSVTPLTGLTEMQVRELTDDKYTSYLSDARFEANKSFYDVNSTTTSSASQAISKDVRVYGDHRSITREGLKFSVLNAITNPYTTAFYDLMTMDGKQIGIDAVRLSGGALKREVYTTWTFSVTDVEGTAKDNQYQTVTGETIQKVPVTTTIEETVVDQNLVNSTKSALDTAKSELATANSNLTTAQNVYNQAKTAYDSSVTYLNNLKSGVSNVEATKQALADAETKLAYDKARLVKAQELVETAKAELTAKQDALISSQKVVATEKSKLSDLQGVLTVKQSELQLAQGVVGKLSADVETAKGILATAKNDLVSAQAYLDSLVNAQENLVKAQEKVALAELSLIEAVSLRDIDKSALETYKDLLVKAKEAYEEALAIYNPLKAEYDRRVELEEMSKTHDITILADGTVVAIPKVFPTMPELPVASIEDVLGTTTVKANEVTGATVDTPAQATSSKVETAEASVLPNTGTDSSMLGVLGMTGLIGLAYASKRRRQN